MDSNQLIQLAKKYQTPLYLYSKEKIIENYLAYHNGFTNYPHQVCYAVKANSNLSILCLLVELGAGFDIVSIGELKRVMAAGGDPKKVIYSGVGKSTQNLKEALMAGIGCFNIESIAEAKMLHNVALELNKKARVSLRINPDVNAHTHPYISTGLKENKFGIGMKDAEKLYIDMAKMPMFEICGIDFHIGSQLTDISPYEEALTLTLALVDRLAEQGITLSHIDIGGGIGIKYNNETLIDPAELIQLTIQKIGARSLTIYMEPGRSIVGNAGVLITEVLLTKENEGKNFAVVDAAMNDLIRPSLYDAWMNIENLSPSSAPEKIYDIVGPVCESTDFLGKDRALSLNAGDMLAVYDAGAYSFSMSSNYNSRARAAEILISKEGVKLIRKRETEEELFLSELEALK